MGYEPIQGRLRGHEGERNNCISKIQLVGQKKIPKLNIFRNLKLDLNPLLPSKRYKFGPRPSQILPSASWAIDS